MTEKETEKKCPFKVGDLVRHRASGEAAVVSCVKRYAQSGAITISRSFTIDALTISALLLELEPDPSKTL